MYVYLFADSADQSNQVVTHGLFSLPVSAVGAPRPNIIQDFHQCRDAVRDSNNRKLFNALFSWSEEISPVVLLNEEIAKVSG